MAAKKKADKKPKKSDRVTSKKMNPTKKTGNKKPAIKGQIPKKQSQRNAQKEVAVNAVGKKSNSTPRKANRERNRTPETAIFSPELPDLPAVRPGGQSGDLQGLSIVEGADSESVVELLEEGNAFEAGVVAGIESAENADQREVHTHQVPEDDVPDEYLDRE